MTHSQTQSVKNSSNTFSPEIAKLYLGKAYTEDQLAKLNEEEVGKLFNNYEAKLSGQMVKLLGHSVINMYMIGVCAALSNQDALSEDLENDPFLNSALQRFTCELYYRFSSFLAPLSVGIIMSRHYLWNRCMTPSPSKGNKNGGTSGDNEGHTSRNDQKLMGHAATLGPASPLTLSNSEVIGSFIGMGMVGFYFGIGLTGSLHDPEPCRGPC